MDRSDGWRELLETYAAQMDQRNRAERRQRDRTPVERLANANLEFHHKLAVKDDRQQTELRLKAGREAFDRLTKQQQEPILRKCASKGWDAVYKEALRKRDRPAPFMEHELRALYRRTPYTLADLTAEITRRAGTGGARECAEATDPVRGCVQSPNA